MQPSPLTEVDAVVAATVGFIQLVLGYRPSLLFSVCQSFPSLTSPLFNLLHLRPSICFLLCLMLSLSLGLSALQVFGPYYSIKVCASVYV